MSMSVVIVEDEALIALDLEGIVEDAGFTVAGPTWERRSRLSRNQPSTSPSSI